MEIKGRIVANLGVESGTSKSGKQWTKASIVVETEGQYPKKILLTHFKEADKFAALQVGALGTFSIEIESREWTNAQGKKMWFTEVQCWKWDVDAQQSAQPQPAYPPTDPYAAAGMQPREGQAPQNYDGDPLPF